jgi:thiamine biosynthesis lipoprotein
LEQPTQQRFELMSLALGLSRTSQAMATHCTVTVVATDPSRLVDYGLQTVARIEQSWSRFLESSDITRLNRARGERVHVAPETAQLISFMKAAHTVTDGAYNPTLLPLQVANGDDRSLDGTPAPDLPADLFTWNTLDGIDLYSDGSARVPSGMSLDAGGIGKGLAADLVARDLLAMGADAACVNIGGDMRMVRSQQSQVSWPVTIAPPHGIDIEEEIISVRDGAVATSDRLARPIAHHYSAHGAVRGDVAGATVVASSAAWAEAWTKFAMTRDIADTISALERIGLAGRIVVADGSAYRTATWEEFAR